jgi:uncharacterized cupin superfamily protein
VNVPKKQSVIDALALPQTTGTGYPPAYRKEVESRARARIGELFGLDQFGVNIVTLPPGAWSSHRHWHAEEDEFIYILEGEITLVDDAGSHVMTTGMCAGFKANSGNGHHLKNLSSKPATYIEVGSRKASDKVMYSDIDMMAVKDGGPWAFLKKDGSGL